MEAVIKVGGSLSENPAVLKALGVALAKYARETSFVVVPGGGTFADAVREVDANFGLPALLSHRMAILAMDQYGLLLSHAIPDASVYDSLEDVMKVSYSGKVSIFLPSKLLLQSDPFEPSWDVTSDSIAAYIAVRLKTPKVLFVTDVDGIFAEEPNKHLNLKLLRNISARELMDIGKKTSVDKFLPRFLLENPLDCYVINGIYPERVKAVLQNQPTICTRIRV
ncbi:MAG: delta 1-pyrroline-5-carboxylate synthetase [Candidatus Bathyarchaeota archaeon]|nr:delta 1-pyrroline-5-carboxylate synthetase [Candidatus Bathyarchaeota archaeon]